MAAAGPAIGRDVARGVSKRSDEACGGCCGLFLFLVHGLPDVRLLRGSLEFADNLQALVDRAGKKSLNRRGREGFAKIGEGLGYGRVQKVPCTRYLVPCDRRVREAMAAARPAR